MIEIKDVLVIFLLGAYSIAIFIIGIWLGKRMVQGDKE